MLMVIIRIIIVDLGNFFTSYKKVSFLHFFRVGEIKQKFSSVHVDNKFLYRRYFAANYLRKCNLMMNFLVFCQERCMILCENQYPRLSS